MKHILPLLLFLTACTPSVYRPYPIEAVVLPNDDAAHLAPIEWWYYTGHLKDEVGHEYGFELSFFKAYAPQTLKLLGFLPAYILAEKGHVAHFAITDKSQGGRFDQAEKADFWGYEGEADSSTLDVKVSNWYTRRSQDGLSHDIYATLENRQLKLTLTPQKLVALHGHPPGIQSMGPGGLSYYLSYTRMKAEGSLSSCRFLSCETSPLTGQAWHDHQWGDFDFSSFAGWDWFGLQLDNNTELMLYLIRQPDGTYSTKTGSFITADGRTLELTQEDFSLLETGETWTSERTEAIYPLGWTIAVPKFGIDIRVNPVIPDQEMDTRSSTGIVYWEGAVDISGSHKGVGYVELTNYDLYPYGHIDKNTPLKPLRGPFGL